MNNPGQLFSGGLLMKKLLASFIWISLFYIPAFAQDVPRAEVYGGYQLLYDVGTTEDGVQGASYHGFTAAFEDSIASYAGIVGEFGFNKHTEMYGAADSWKNFSFLFGPRITACRTEQFRIFGHLMFGANLSTISAPESYESKWSLGYALGGGMDVVINKMISVRLAQIDLSGERTSTDDFGPWSNHFRYSGGVVFKFGSR